MKRFSIISSVFLVLIVFAMDCFPQLIKPEQEARTNPQNALDYFLILPEIPFLTPSVIYESEYYQRAAFISSGSYRDRTIIIDTVNNYFLIRQSAPELEIELSMSLFHREGKKPIVGVGYSFSDSACFSSYVKFYEYNDDGWRNLTYEVLPKISYNQFWIEGTTVPDPLIFRLDLFYEMPRYGKVITVRPVNDCPPQQHVMTANEWKIYDAFFDTQTYQAMKLKWDCDSETFTLFSKVKNSVE